MSDAWCLRVWMDHDGSWWIRAGLRLQHVAGHRLYSLMKNGQISVPSDLADNCAENSLLWQGSGHCKRQALQAFAGVAAFKAV